jgi:hypothetical protein
MIATIPPWTIGKPGHRWSDCPMCGQMVVCGKCGNNCCNGGYGTLPDGKTCDACPSAYDMQDEGRAIE